MSALPTEGEGEDQWSLGGKALGHLRGRMQQLLSGMGGMGVFP
jgi:hypothetical protein